jgi:predicted SAM-dependent methyltransferase
MSTDIDMLDITKEKDWAKLFYKGSLSNIVAEHVFEHLSPRDCKKAFGFCYEYLRRGGVLRIAVPDKNRRDLLYVKEVSPPSDGHKSYFDYSTLEKMLTLAGFKVNKLEWHDKEGVFYHKKYDNQLGKIQRSFTSDRQKKFKSGDHYYTSLIVDAIKS